MRDDSIININTVDAMIQLSKEVMINSNKCTIYALIGSGCFVDTNDDVSEETIVNLRYVDLGGLKLNNVRASVVRNQKAPLLLGQSVRGRLGSIEIDRNRFNYLVRKHDGDNSESLSTYKAI